ncbi:MAG: 50S ribosomal protein L15 [Candidatus Pacebacteria bacterium]|nr:50S ribosomal protein L15 [Candidatus Paceibacterota bacterium]
MRLHQIKKQHPNKKRTRIGRGGKRGKTSGRGHKGQNARAGTSKRPEMRDIIKKLPKRRGYRFKSIQEKPLVVGLAALEKNFANADNVNPKELLSKSLIQKKKGKLPVVKILANGKISKKIIVSGCQFSQTAKKKIEEAGGKIDACLPAGRKPISP